METNWTSQPHFVLKETVHSDPQHRWDWLHSQQSFRVCRHADRSGSICNTKVFLGEINSPRGATLCGESLVTLYERKPRQRHFRMKNILNTLSLGQRIYFNFWPHPFSSVKFNRSFMPKSLWPHGLQHAKLPCPSPTPRACSNSCPSSQWCHPTISSSVIPFFSHLQSFSASGSFPMSQFLASGGQSIGVSASGSVFPMNI